MKSYFKQFSPLNDFFKENSLSFDKFFTTNFSDTLFNTNDLETINACGEVNEDDTKYTIIMEMPGVPKDSIDIKVESDKLTITGKRKKTEDTNVVSCSRSSKEFKNIYRLNHKIDSSNIEAELKDGILTLTLPKSEIVQPKTINIKSL